MLTACLTFACAAQAAADDGNLAVNGSFEIRAEGMPNPHIDTLTSDRKDLVGWQIVGKSIDWIGPTRWKASDGEYCLDLDAPGGVQQTFKLSPGRDYQLQFDLAGNVEIEPALKTLRVSIDGERHEFSFDAAGHTRENLGWERKEILFTARSDTTTITFSNASPTPTASGVALDHVFLAEITPVRYTVRRLEQFGAKVTLEDGVVKRVDLTDSLIGDANLEMLRSLGTLEHLTLNGCRRLSDAGLAPLQGLSQLKGLGLERTRITDAGIAHLSGFENLEYLSLNWTRVGDAGLNRLANLTNLAVLYLCDTPTADAGLAALGKMSNLQWLDLRGTNITDAGLNHLTKLPRLRLLCLYGTGITDAGTPLLSELPNLEVLSLNFTEVSDLGLRSLTKAEKLKELELTGTRVTQAGAERFKQALPNCRVRFDDETPPANPVGVIE